MTLLLPQAAPSPFQAHNGRLPKRARCVVLWMDGLMGEEAVGICQRFCALQKAGEKNEGRVKIRSLDRSICVRRRGVCEMIQTNQNPEEILLSVCVAARAGQRSWQGRVDWNPAALIRSQPYTPRRNMPALLGCGSKVLGAAETPFATLAASPKLRLLASSSTRTRKRKHHSDSVFPYPLLPCHARMECRSTNDCLRQTHNSPKQPQGQPAGFGSV
jgi:hypothetical protein